MVTKPRDFKVMKKIPVVCLSLFLMSVFLPAKEVLIIYDGEPARSEAFVSARFTRNLMGHFSVDRTDILHASDYKEHVLDAYDVLFIIFEDAEPSFPDVFLHDIASGTAVVVWMHSHIDLLLEQYPETWNIRYQSSLKKRDWSIHYKKQVFLKTDPWLNAVQVKNFHNVNVYSWAHDSRGRRFPYILKTGRLWYIADSPFAYAAEGGRFLILADLLHDILDEKHPPNHRALIRIEDVSPLDNPGSIKKIARYLNRKNVPFHISLIPIYKDPAAQIEVTLTDKPEMVKALKYAVKKGGTIVLHGSTHQHRGASADDFEFWNDISGEPIPHTTSDWVDLRLQKAFDVCFDNEIFPLAWETPHYSASQNDYKTFAEYFNTFYDRVMAAEISGTQQIFPYPARIRGLDITVIPENLGYIDIGDPDPESLLENAEKMLVVRDGVASFFFHSFVPIKHLKFLVKNMKKTGWRFISLKDFSCTLRTEKISITTDEQNRLMLENQYIRERIFDEKGKLKREKVSSVRHKGMVTKKIQLKPRSVYVMEALEEYPESTDQGIWAKTADFIKSLFDKESTEPIRTTETLVLTAENLSEKDTYNQKSFESVLKVFGFSPHTRAWKDVSSSEISGFDLLVIPHATAVRLDRSALNAVTGFAEKGGWVILDGKSLLAEKLGIRFEKREVDVAEVRELSMPAENIFWNPPVNLSPFTAREAVFLCKDAWRDIPLAVILPFHRGKILFLGARFDPYSPYGYSRFPFFPHYLKNSLGIPFNVRRNNLEFYFDPGLHQNTSWEKLVKRWKESGVRIVYLAAWHFYPGYRFDYGYFIQLCHDHGIAVYAWFEFPQVSPLFWEQHPEWREKTATGDDAKPHWRLLMNLANKQAREAAGMFMNRLLTSYDWDGVNLAELNFDTNEGAEDPEKFTPMNPDVRKDFKEKEGFDPLKLFDVSSGYYWRANPAAFEKFLSFRREVITSLHVYFLEIIETVRKQKERDMEVIVTCMDSLFHPETVEESGIDTHDILSLMDRFPFTLQVEDPSRSWTRPPARYLDYYMEYRKHIKDPGRLMFDINVISRRDISGTPSPSALSIGTELATTLYYASLPSGRTGIYSEYTIHPFDMDLLPFVISSEVRLQSTKEGIIYTSKEPFTLSINRTDLHPRLDKKRWPFFGSRGINLPSGNHLLSLEKAGTMDLSQLAPKILMGADIDSFEVSGNTYTLVYRSPVPVPLTYSRPLDHISIDGEPLELSSETLGAVLPKGRHMLEIKTRSSSFQIIDEVGYVSSSVFYFLGFISVVILGGIYLTFKMTAR